MKELFKEVETHMKHALDHFHHELKHLRTGRASLALLEGITVDYYGSPVPLNQVANLSVADAVDDRGAAVRPHARARRSSGRS